MGADIQGEFAEDGSGTSIVMSDNGKVIAIGEPYSEAGNTGKFEKDFGQVRVFRWKQSKDKWVQRGQAIIGINPYDFASEGGGLAMDASGLTVVIGSADHDVNGFDGRFQGHARVFDWDGTNWIQRGSDMNGEAPGDWFGHAVAVSSLGNTVAVGALFNDVRIFDWDTNSTEWLQRGSYVDGEQ